MEFKQRKRKKKLVSLWSSKLKHIEDFMNKLINFFITLYQKHISPLKPATCRFYPSCSEYAAQALKKYGLLKGLRLSAGRILRCHPFNPGGYDPLPDSSGVCAHKK